MQTNAENICDKVATNHNNEDDIKDEMNQLQHNDSHSSGYFSQDNSEQSHVSLREVAEDLNVDIMNGYLVSFYLTMIVHLIYSLRMMKF